MSWILLPLSGNGQLLIRYDYLQYKTLTSACPRGLKYQLYKNAEKPLKPFFLTSFCVYDEKLVRVYPGLEEFDLYL